MSNVKQFPTKKKMTLMEVILQSDPDLIKKAVRDIEAALRRDAIRKTNTRKK